MTAATGVTDVTGDEKPRLRGWIAKRSKGWRIVGGVLLLAAVALAVTAAVRRRSPGAVAAPGEILASGRIEARDVVLTPRAPARVVRLMADEGDAVTAGQVVVETDDEVFRKQVEALDARVKALHAQLRSVEVRVALTKRLAPLRIREAAAAVRAAEAAERQGEAARAQALRDRARAEELVATGSVPKQQGEVANLTALQAEQRALMSASDTARGRTQLDVARASVDEVAVAEAELEALRGQVAQAEAELSAQREALGALSITSPISGIVLARNVEPGERVVPGTPLLTLVDPQRLTLKVYVAEPNIGRIVLGQPACVHIDAYPDRVFPGRVQRVSQRAEFTPKNVETREERVHLVFAIELALSNAGGVLKPGMPADARIGCEPQPDTR